MLRISGIAARSKVCLLAAERGGLRLPIQVVCSGLTIVISTYISLAFTDHEGLSKLQHRYLIKARFPHSPDLKLSSGRFDSAAYQV